MAGTTTGGVDQRLVSPNDHGRSEPSEAELRKAEGKIAANMAVGLAFWAGSLEAYRTLVNEWMQARQNALQKSMTALLDLKSNPEGGQKAEQAAEILIDQWTSFQRDIISAQIKTAARVGGVFDEARQRAVEASEEINKDVKQYMEKATDDVRKMTNVFRPS